MTLTVIPLSGFLGAGKTTTMLAAATALEAGGTRVAVVTNDQGVDLVDTATARRAAVPVDEVTGGCFCCRFEDLADLVDRILAAGTADTVVVEAVGSCTDLQATVVRPLREIYGDRLRVAPLTTVVDPLRYRAFATVWDRGEESDIAYLFDHQIAEADIVAVGKSDLLTPAEMDAVTGQVSSRYPRATVVGYSAATGADLGRLLAAWSAEPSAEWDVAIDYDRYAQAEAELAWLNRSYDLHGAAVDLTAWCSAVMDAVHDSCRERDLLVGHVKIRASSVAGDVKLSLVGGEPVVDERVTEPVGSARAVVNARVSCPPEEMDAILDDAVALADRAGGVTSAPVGASSSFQPGYPTPVHRVPARV
jgi:Ni2+-binding GTPase involved in maturation of urease and hydrogenase